MQTYQNIRDVRYHPAILARVQIFNQKLDYGDEALRVPSCQSLRQALSSVELLHQGNRDVGRFVDYVGPRDPIQSFRVLKLPQELVELGRHLFRLLLDDAVVFAVEVPPNVSVGRFLANQLLFGGVGLSLGNGHETVGHSGYDGLVVRLRKNFHIILIYFS